MKQKLLALLVMALFVPLAANAYDACIDGIYYNIVMKAKQATVTYGENEEGTYSEKVVIPEKINYNGIICDVVGIGTRAFTNCKLSNLTLPQSLTKIDQYAFGKYFEVDSLCITDLTSWCNIEFNDEYSNPIRYASALFVNNEKVTNLVIPNGIKSVKNYAFYSAKMLTSVKLSDSVEAIGTKAFYFCSGLKSVTWGKGVTSVGQDAFKECNNIERVNISDLKAWLSVDFGISSVYGSLGEGIYRFIQNPLYYAGHLYLNGSELTDVVVPDGIETLWAHAFEGYTAITSLVIPDGVKDFKSRGYEGSTLSDCHNLRSVKIGAGLKEMQILNCASLTSLEVGDGKIKIEISKCPLLKESGIKIYNAQDIEIEQCNAITELTLANIVNATNKFNIYSCSGLKKLQIPDGVSSAYVRNCPALTTLILGMGLNGLTVDGCKELTDVYNPMTTPKHVSFGFGNDCLIEYATLHIPGESIDAYKATEPWSKFGTIIALKEGDPGYADNPNVGGIITFADSRVGKICVDNWDTNDDGKLSEQEAAAVKSIGTVFKDNTQLVTFYELKYFTGLTAIDDDSFNGCTNLKNISIPETVTSFGNRAFEDCI
ncbi:MAG: leucine-rich repeat protein [Prevotella sp.]|nr:leucine-rich repeat protein [Prevotella sp.]